MLKPVKHTKFKLVQCGGMRVLSFCFSLEYQIRLTVLNTKHLNCFISLQWVVAVMYFLLNIIPHFLLVLENMCESSLHLFFALRIKLIENASFCPKVTLYSALRLVIPQNPKLCKCTTGPDLYFIGIWERGSLDKWHLWPAVDYEFWLVPQLYTETEMCLKGTLDEIVTF